MMFRSASVSSPAASYVLMWCFKWQISPGAWTLLGGLAGTVWSFPHRVHCLCSAVCCRLEPRIVFALGLVAAVATPVVGSLHGGKAGPVGYDPGRPETRSERGEEARGRDRQNAAHRTQETERGEPTHPTRRQQQPLPTAARTTDSDAGTTH